MDISAIKTLNVHEDADEDFESYDISINVMSNEELKRTLQELTDTYASIVANTAGPFGKNTIIQTADRTYSTKDGWTVAQALTVKEDPKVKSLAKMILDVSATVNRKVGDGTTTSIIAASYLLNNINDYVDSHDCTAKEVENALKSAVQIICSYLDHNAKEITDENLRDVIRSLAKISTNWDDDYAEMISEIYEKTHNPIINIQDSGTDKSYVEYTEGYDIKAQLQLQNFYLLNTDSSGYTKLNHPLVAVFGYTIGARMFQMISTMAAFASQNGCPLVVLAPGFDQDFLTTISSYNTKELRAKRSCLPMYPVVYHTPSYVEKDMIDDLCALLGATYITKQDADLEAVIGDLNNVIFSPPNMLKEGATPEEKADHEKRMSDWLDTKQKAVQLAYNEFLENVGTCEEVWISDRKFQAVGLTNKIEDLVSSRLEKLKLDMEEKSRKAEALNFITTDMYPTRMRMGKLQCKMGTIYIGGYGDSNLSAIRAALDDATRACESAYIYGYTMGGGYAVPHACHVIANSPEFDNFPPMVQDMIHSIYSAFYDVICDVATNKYERNISEIDVSGNKITDLFGHTVGDVKSVDDMIEEGIVEGKPFNLLTNELDDAVLEPAVLGSEALKASMRIVMISATSNQYLYRDY